MKEQFVKISMIALLALLIVACAPPPTPMPALTPVVESEIQITIQDPIIVEAEETSAQKLMDTYGQVFLAKVFLRREAGNVRVQLGDSWYEMNRDGVYVLTEDGRLWVPEQWSYSEFDWGWDQYLGADQVKVVEFASEVAYLPKGFTSFDTFIVVQENWDEEATNVCISDGLTWADYVEVARPANNDDEWADGLIYQACGGYIFIIYEDDLATNLVSYSLHVGGMKVERSPQYWLGYPVAEGDVVYILDEAWHPENDQIVLDMHKQMQQAFLNQYPGGQEIWDTEDPKGPIDACNDLQALWRFVEGERHDVETVCGLIESYWQRYQLRDIEFLWYEPGSDVGATVLAVSKTKLPEMGECSVFPETFEVDGMTFVREREDKEHLIEYVSSDTEASIAVPSESGYYLWFGTNIPYWYEGDNISDIWPYEGEIVCFTQ